MNESLDKLLAEVRAEYYQSAPPPLPTPEGVSPPPPDPLAHATPNNTSRDPSPPNSLGSGSADPLGDPLDRLLRNLGQPHSTPELRSTGSVAPVPDPHLQTVLKSIKTEYLTQAKLSQQELEWLQQEQEQDQHKQNQERAERWLKDLDPQSFEAEWFGVFSRSFPSSVEAAITYLRALDALPPEGGVG